MLVHEILSQDKTVLREIMKKPKVLNILEQDMFPLLKEELNNEELNKLAFGDFVDIAFSEFKFYSVGVEHVGKARLYGSCSLNEGQISIRIWENLILLPNARPVLRCTELHEICHALRFYAYTRFKKSSRKRRLSDGVPPPSPEQFRPSPHVSKAYGLKKNEGELGLWFQEKLLEGTALWDENFQASRVVEHNGTKRSVQPVVLLFLIQ